jgi:putative ABC transport system ATP-binding protein
VRIERIKVCITIGYQIVSNVNGVRNTRNDGIKLNLDPTMGISVAFSEDAPVLRTNQLEYSYGGSDKLLFPDIVCQRGQHLLISGNSGVGKTTLLHLMGGLLRVQRGKIEVGGQSLSLLGNNSLDLFRGRYIGLVFQQARFVSSLNVIENVIAAQYFGCGKGNRTRALKLLEELGIAHKGKELTNELSGGERQRLSIARALASGAPLVLADEPTSSLDDTNADNVYELLVREANSNGATLVVVTHDARLKNRFQHRVEL